MTGGPLCGSAAFIGIPAFFQQWPAFIGLFVARTLVGFAQGLPRLRANLPHKVKCALLLQERIVPNRLPQRRIDLHLC